MAEIRLRSVHIDSALFINDKGEVTAWEAPGSFPIAGAMQDAVDEYDDEVRSHLERLVAPELYVEERVFPLPERDDLFGTADAIIVEPYGELIVIDFKYGAGVVVEVEENDQMLYYALGALNAVGDDAAVSSVTLVVVQPRASHSEGTTRRWTTTVARLREFEGQIRSGAEATRRPDAPLMEGPHCRWCPAAAICPKLRTKALVAASLDFAVAEPQAILPDSADVKAVARALRFADLAEDWAAKVREMAYRGLETGTYSPSELGFKLVQKSAHRKWRNDAEAAQALRLMGFTDDQIASPPELKSPAQIEKLLKKAGAAFTETHAWKPPGGIGMVPIGDKRPALPPAAVRDFEPLVEEGTPR